MSELEPDRRYRLSDSERDDALEHLRTALQEGRLDLAEHDRRSEAVLHAVTNADLTPLFDDLPQALRPGVITAIRTETQVRKKSEEKTASTEDEGKGGGPNVNGLVIWGGIIFVIWGIPAIAYGGGGALIGWLIFLVLFMVPAVTIATVQALRKRSNEPSEIEE
ncbi:DUF1707 SHOCT-like domain-containing protein [Nocardiopsis alkaliphila]|uniref:DUF1707 SHOCT-like domain-containing protein n=1 Tax=Nocardiopsis alkaliphila TaxID=225762 RepID=UPI000348D16E|nr:DUF1707 domain-containing protein [Nocardiopsis alkaliphila]